MISHRKKDLLPATLYSFGTFQNKILTNFLDEYANTIKSVYRIVHFYFFTSKAREACWVLSKVSGFFDLKKKLFDLNFFLIASKASQSNFLIENKPIFAPKMSAQKVIVSNKMYSIKVHGSRKWQKFQPKVPG